MNRFEELAFSVLSLLFILGPCWSHLHSYRGTKGRVWRLPGLWREQQALQVQDQGAWLPPPRPDGPHRQKPHVGRHCRHHWYYGCRVRRGGPIGLFFRAVCPTSNLVMFVPTWCERNTFRRRSHTQKKELPEESNKNRIYLSQNDYMWCLSHSLGWYCMAS